MKYKGNYVDFQRVRAKKTPKINVMSEERSKPVAMQEEEKANLLNSGQARKPDWTLEMINNENEAVEFDPLSWDAETSAGLEYTLKLPLLVTGRPISSPRQIHQPAGLPADDSGDMRQSVPHQVQAPVRDRGGEN
jgi:hypothetical protein